MCPYSYSQVTANRGTGSLHIRCHRVFVHRPSEYRMRFASIIRKRWERGVRLVVTLEVSWGTSSNPRHLAPEDAAKYLRKDAAWDLNTLLSFLPTNKVEILGLLWLPVRGREWARIPRAVSRLWHQEKQAWREVNTFMCLSTWWMWMLPLEN